MTIVKFPLVILCHEFRSLISTTDLVSFPLVAWLLCINLFIICVSFFILLASNKITYVLYTSVRTLNNIDYGEINIEMLDTYVNTNYAEVLNSESNHTFNL